MRTPTRLSPRSVFGPGWIPVVLGLLVAGCAGVAPGGVPPLTEIPWVDAGGGDEEAIRAARRSWYAGDERAALAAAEEILASNPRHVDAHRIRQDVLRQRGRLGLLVVESERRLAADPDDPVALYLAGRLAVEDGERMRWFGRCIEVAPDWFWSWLGFAFAIRTADPERSVALYEQLYDRSDGHPLAAVALAAAYRSNAQIDAAQEVYRGLSRTGLLGGDGLNGVGELGLAETYMMSDRPNRAWAPLLQALKLRPHDPGLLVVIRDLEARGLGEERRSQLLDVMRSDPDGARSFARAGGRAVYADLLLRAGRPQGALEVLEQDGEPQDPASRLLWRRLLLGEGSVGRFLDILRRDIPRELLTDETNRVRGLWLTLMDGSWADLDGGGAAWGERGPAFVRALMAVGLLYEAETAAQMVLRHAPDGSRDRTALTAIQRELAFEGALRRVVYRSYKRNAGGEELDLDELLEEIRAVSIEILGEDVVGTPERYSVPLVGQMIDPFGPGLPAHLARFNRHLTLGQRSGSVPEGLLLTRVVVRDLPEIPELPTPTRCTEVVGENRSIRSISGVYGGDLAGIALLNHYVVDLDAAREWGLELLRKRAIARQDGLALLGDPVPEGGSLYDGWGVDWRLAVMADGAVGGPPGAAGEMDGDFTLAVLDMIRWHEHAHISDFFHYLPPEANLLRNVALVAQGGFSSLGVEATMECRAEGATLALSPHTHLVMAHIAEFLAGDRERSAHALGFSDLAGELVQRLEAAGVPAADCAPRFWHRLDPELVRRIAGEILAERY